MTALVLILAAIPALWWLCLSPLRITLAGIPLALTHPTLTVTVVVALAALVLAVGAVIIGRNLRDVGWCLVSVFDREVAA